MIIYQTEHATLENSHWISQSSFGTAHLNATLDGAMSDASAEFADLVQESFLWDDSEYYKMEKSLKWSIQYLHFHRHTNLVQPKKVWLARYCLVDGVRWEAFAISEKKIGA